MIYPTPIPHTWYLHLLTLSNDIISDLTQTKSDVIISFLLFYLYVFIDQLSSQTFPSPFSCIFRHWMCWFLQHTSIIHFLLRTINHTTHSFFFHLSIHSFIFIVLHLNGAACYDLLSLLLTYFLNLHSVNLLPICRNVKSRNLSSLILSYLGFCNMIIFYCSWSPSLS